MAAARQAATEARRIAASSRAAGAPVPASAAATAPPVAAYVEIPRSALEGVKEQAVEVEESLTADASLSPQYTSENPEKDQLRAEIARIRKIRKPFGALTQKLALDKRYGYHRHWFNDQAGRVQEAEENGWSFIEGKDGKPLRRPVGMGRDNGVLYAYAMELPEVFWEEDMAARHAEAAAKLATTKGVKPQGIALKKEDSSNFYSPSGREDAVQVSTGRGSNGMI